MRDLIQRQYELNSGNSVGMASVTLRFLRNVAHFWSNPSNDIYIYSGRTSLQLLALFSARMKSLSFSI